MDFWSWCIQINEKVIIYGSFTQFYQTFMVFHSRNVIFNNEFFYNHVCKKYDQYVIIQAIVRTLQQKFCNRIWSQTRRDFNFWSRRIQINEKIMKYGNFTQFYQILMVFQIGNAIFNNRYFFATAYPKNMINMSFYRLLHVLSNELFFIKFKNILKDI